LCRASDERAVAIVTTIGQTFRQNGAHGTRIFHCRTSKRGGPLEIDETIGHAVAMARRMKLEVPLLENFLGQLGAVGSSGGGGLIARWPPGTGPPCIA